jgi:hypothetical protein
MKKIIIALSLLLGCNALKVKDETFSFQRLINKTQTIKLKGYYYSYLNNNTQKNIFFFYENGLFIDIQTFENKTFEEIEAFCSSEFFLKRQLNVLKRMYGIYKIENKKLTIESYYLKGTAHGVANYYCNIINDSAFQIMNISDHNSNTDVSSENRIYHFRQYSPKPDSTNSFIP